MILYISTCEKSLISWWSATCNANTIKSGKIASIENGRKFFFKFSNKTACVLLRLKEMQKHNMKRQHTNLRFSRRNTTRSNSKWSIYLFGNAKLLSWFLEGLLSSSRWKITCKRYRRLYHFCMITHQLGEKHGCMDVYCQFEMHSNLTIDVRKLSFRKYSRENDLDCLLVRTLFVHL